MFSKHFLTVVSNIIHDKQAGFSSFGGNDICDNVAIYPKPLQPHVSVAAFRMPKVLKSANPVSNSTTPLLSTSLLGFFFFLSSSATLTISNVQDSGNSLSLLYLPKQMYFIIFLLGHHALI